MKTPVMQRVAEDGNAIITKPIKGAEDLSYFANEIPGLFIGLGVAKEGQMTGAPNHSPYFYVNDAALPVGAGVLYGGVVARGDSGGPMQYMLNAIVEDFADTADYTGIDAPSERVMAALSRVPREEYVPEGSRSQAYFNRAMGIGYGQTISQPFIVALMTEVLALQPTDRVLEIGTGSGYQAAILGELVDEVYTIEIVPELAKQADARLRQQGYDNIHVRSGNGRLGWPEAAPFDAVIVTAGGDEVPLPLLDQLKPGGRLVIPVGNPYGSQVLTLYRKDTAGEVSQTEILPVVFVPLTGDG